MASTRSIAARAVAKAARSSASKPSRPKRSRSAQSACAKLKAEEDREAAKIAKIRERREALEKANEGKRKEAEGKLEKKQKGESDALAKKHATEQEQLTKRFGCTPKPPRRRKKGARKGRTSAPVATVSAAITVPAPAPTLTPRPKLPAPAPTPPNAVPQQPRAASTSKGRSRQCGDVCHLKLEGSWCGQPASVVLPSAVGKPRVIPARFCLTDAESLVPSHDATTFAPRADYPTDTQERRYDVDTGEQVKVATIAQNLVPRLVQNTNAGALDGTPVATEAGVILGGNGRTMGIQRHYRIGRGELRDYLLERARDFGLTRADVARYKHPVIVRVIEAGDPATYPRLVRDLNERLSQALDPRAELVSLGRQFNEEGMQILSANLNDEDLPTWLSSRDSRPFVAYLQRRGIVTSNNASRLLTDGGLLSTEGKELVGKLLAGAVLPDAMLLDAVGPEVQKTLARGAPYILAAAASGGAWDLRPAIAAAVHGIVDARASGVSFTKYAQQTSLVPRPIDASDQTRRMFQLLAKLHGSPLKWAAFARRFAELAAQNPRGQASMFAPLSAAEAEDIAVKEALA